MLTLLRGLLLVLLCCSATAAEPLTLSYFERPPYYFTAENGHAEGLLVERVRTIFAEAGIAANFISLTPYRILYTLQHAKVQHCSIGWFKTPERELFAKFSQPFYRNEPLVLLTSKAQLGKFLARNTLRELFADRTLIMARLAEFTYGAVVDELFTEQQPKSLYLTGEQAELLRAVVQQKAAYMLVAPEEIGMLAQTVGVSPEELHTINLADLSVGNLRYLMCSQSVTDATLESLNKSIAKRYPLQD